MGSDLVTISADSLRTLGCISSGPIDMCMFRILRWLRTSSFLTVGGALPLWSHSCSPSTGEVWEERLPVKTEAKNVVEYLSLLLVRCYQSCSLGGYTFFNLPLLVDIPVEALIIILSILCQIWLQTCLGLHDLIPL